MIQIGAILAPQCAQCSLEKLTAGRVVIALASAQAVRDADVFSAFLGARARLLGSFP